MPKYKFSKFITIIFLLLASSLIGCGASDAGDIVSGQSTVEQEMSADVGTESAQELTQKQDKQGDLGKSDAGSDERNTQENSGTLETEPNKMQESETSEALTEEIDDLYGFGPVSYDLSALPAMENKLYAEWEGNIYFRQYSDEDVEKGALWAEFGYIPGTEKELMCLTPDGELTQVGTDYGCGAMYIVNGRLYSQKKMREGDADSIGEYIVYSCNLDGSDVREYDSDTIFAVRDDKVICGGYMNRAWYLASPYTYSSLSYIDAQTGEEHILVETKTDSYFYLGATEEGIFYYGDYYNRDVDSWDLRIYSVDYEANILSLTTVTATEFADDHDLNMKYFTPYLDIPYFRIMGDELYFVVGWYDGSAEMFQDGSIYSMKKDGNERKVQALSYDTKFYMYDDGVNRALFCSTIDEKTGKVAENGKMVPINLMGHAPQNIVLRIANGYSYDEPYVYSSTAYDPLYHTVYPDTSVLLYPDTSGICYVLLTEQDCEELSIDAYVDGHFSQDIKDVEYLDGKLFFTVTDLTYSFEDSIGWRDGYLRGRTACYCKDLESGEIRLLYEY